MSRRVGVPAAVLAPVLTALTIAAVLAGPLADVVPAAAQSQNRVAVIVHTGGGSAAVCVRFDEATITGLDALQRAGLGAVVRSFSGQGAAVCGINGVGCPADGSCLTCQAPSYWAYHRAGPGAGGFTFSGVGAGATRVSDGSVEGWQWGTGAPPPFQTTDQVCGAAAPPSPAPSPAPSPGGQSGPGPQGESGSAGEGSTGEASPTTGVVTTTTADATTTTSAGADGAEQGEGADGADVDADLAAAVTSDSEGGGRPWAVVVFLALLTAAGAGAIVVWRRRVV